MQLLWLPYDTKVCSFFYLNLQVLRLKKVNSHINTIHSLSFVMSIDFLKTVGDVHPSLIDPGQSKSISNDTLARLTGVINSLIQDKQQRLHKVMFMYDC